MISDRDILSFRQDYYEMLVALLRKEPSGELLQRLANGSRERGQAAGNLHPLLGEGWKALERFMAGTPPEQLAETVAEEYVQLFIGPLAAAVNPYESFYLTGRLLARPLAAIRDFLKAVGIEKLQEYPEPEDFLAFELEVMRWLISKQMAASDPNNEKQWIELQADFLKEHLLVWGPACAKDIERAEGAKFYRCAGKILQGFLELELNFFREWGVDKVLSIEAARQRYGAVPAWKGPTFDMSGDMPGGAKPEAHSSQKKELPHGARPKDAASKE
jgi:TorA maturation chaperone TorD